MRARSGSSAAAAGASSVGVIGDDCRFRTPGWDVAIDGWLTEHVGVAWPDDGWAHAWSSEEKAAHWWLSRAVVYAMGVCPPTKHFYMDDYWAQLGRAAGCARYFGDVVVEHLHPLAGKGENDATYTRTRRWIARDRAWWRTWLSRGMRPQLAQLRALVGVPSLRVFSDWHHPALWEALSILFEDRFGWQLYSPIGTEWRRHGWRLAGGTPGWEADDYLVHPDAVDVGGHYTLVEPEFPERPRKLVTFDQWAAMPWDVVVASVGQHQRTFSLLARSKGARFVHHVGDARRRIERVPRQIIVASSNIPGAAVVHHQEFDRQMFAFDTSGDRAAVSSFMLRLRTTSGPHEWLSGARGVHWWAADSEAMRDERYLAPMSEVAARMRASGWVWHDKRIGDGYGHVLFTAAAMGRPLIGHASHYQGLLGERLWEDGVTCIDLDRHEPADALRTWRAVVDDPDRYAGMSAAIRDRFDELVDFDAEADAIRAVLGD